MKIPFFTSNLFQPLCALIVLVICDTSEGLFFHFPKRALMNFLESLGGKKQANPIHHYHMHYYPIPLILPTTAPPSPKIEIDLSALQSHGHLSSMGWTSQDYNKAYDSEILVPPLQLETPSWPSPLPKLWPDSAPVQQKSWAWDNNKIFETTDQMYKEAKPPGVLLQVPLKQQILFYQPPAKDKSSLLSILFKKIRRLNDALFHPEEDSVEDSDNKPRITNSLTYSAA